MTEKVSEGDRSSPTLEDSCFNIISQIEKKADFVHSVAEQYVRDADQEHNQDLAQLWTTIKEDEKRHIRMLKEQLAREVREGSFFK